MISLAAFVEEHHKAVNYDLLTKTGYELADVGGALSWDALHSFISCLGTDSATMREVDPEVSPWATTAKTNALLADMFDNLSVISANLRAIGSGKRAERPEKYPRPKKNKNDKIFKSSATPDEMRAFIEEGRRARGKR